jgi:hypothetical protein
LKIFSFSFVLITSCLLISKGTISLWIYSEGNGLWKAFTKPTAAVLDSISDVTRLETAMISGNLELMWIF